MKSQLAGDLMTAIMNLPDDHYVTIGKEKNEDGEWFLAACVMQSAPEHGWESRGAYFGDPPDSSTHKMSPDPWRDDDVARVGVSATIDEPHVLERLLIFAINRHWPPA